jgi:hypothetical protein
VDEILDAVEQRAESKKLRSLRNIRGHAKAVRKTFAFTRAVDLSTGDIEQYIKERKDAGRPRRRSIASSRSSGARIAWR